MVATGLTGKQKSMGFRALVLMQAGPVEPAGGRFCPTSGRAYNQKFGGRYAEQDRETKKPEAGSLRLEKMRQLCSRPR